MSALLRRHTAAAFLLACFIVAVGVRWSTRVAGGADGYGYVSQADLWLRGDLFIDQSFGADVPWPLARWTFTPLGYRPEQDGYRIVPLYSPGLPMLMAGAKAIAGACAIFWVVPLMGGALVFGTYWIGRRMQRPIVGLAAACMVAASPAMLFMLMAPMSDVPAAAAWTAAAAMLASGSAAGGGVAAAVAVLIRPNLVPLAVPLAIFALVTLRWKKAALFSLLAGVGAVVVAVINTKLYGSPLSSGYGDLSTAYSWSFVLPNLRRYTWWIASAETPLPLVGLAALYVPSAVLWPTPESRRMAQLFAAAAALIWISYLVYVPWDAWWYLRFLLPAWPMMAIGAASAVSALYRRGPAAARIAAAAVIALAGANGIVQAIQRDVFAMADGEAKYVETARVVETISKPDDVVLTAQYSGSLRYYAERLTLRWDFMEPEWLDRSVQWLQERGHRTYLLIEEGEVAPFRDRFAANGDIGKLDWDPLISFRDGAVKLYDVTARETGAPPTVQAPLRAITECLPQRPFPRLR